MPQSRVERLEERMDQFERWVGEGFVEHRRLIAAHIDGRLRKLQIDLQTEIASLRTELRAELHSEIGALRTEMRRGDAFLRAQMRDGFAAVNARIDAQATETGARFDRLESKLDTFVEAQSAISQRLLEYMERHA